MNKEIVQKFETSAEQGLISTENVEDRINNFLVRKNVAELSIKETMEN